MSQFQVLRKILASVVMTSLLSLPLVGITENNVFTSFEDALFEVALLDNDRGTTENSLLKTEPELASNADLVPAEELHLSGDSLQSSVKPSLAALSPKDVASEIFIPPQTVS